MHLNHCGVAHSSSAALARSGPILANCFLDGSRLLVLSTIQLWHTDAVRAIHPSKPGHSDLRLHQTEFAEPEPWIEPGQGVVQIVPELAEVY